MFALIGAVDEDGDIMFLTGNWYRALIESNVAVNLIDIIHQHGPKIPPNAGTSRV